MALTSLDVRFGGGLNNKDADFNILDDQSSDCQNIIFDESRTIKTRPGYTTHGDDLGSNSCLGAGAYYYDDGAGTTTFNLFQVVDTDFYLDVSGTWTAQSRTLTTGIPGNFVQANNELYYFNGTDAVENLSNTTWSTLASGAPMSGSNNIGRFGVYKGGMLFVSGTNANPSRVYVSGDSTGSLDTPEDFSGGWEYDIGTGDSTGKVSGLIQLGDYVLVFKNTGIYKMQGPTGDTQSIITITREIGCAEYRTIQTDEQWVYFQAGDGHVYACDGVNVIKQSEVIVETIDNVNTSQLTKSNAAVYDYNGRKYILNYASGSSTNADATLMFDLERSSIASQDYNDKVWVPWSGINSAVMVEYTSDGSKSDLYFGESTEDSLFYLMFDGTNDNGTAIDAYYVTKNFSGTPDTGNQPEVDKLYRYLYVGAKATGAWNLDVQFSVNGSGFTGTTPSTIDLTPNGAVLPATLPWTLDDGFIASYNMVHIPIRGRFIKFKFANDDLDEYFEIYDATARFRFEKFRKHIDIS